MKKKMILKVTYFGNIYKNMSRDIPSYILPNREEMRISRLENKNVVKYFNVHRHKYYEIIIITSCTEGSFSHSIDFVSYPLEAGYIYFIAPGQTHEWDVKIYNGEYKGFLITFNKSFLLSGNISLTQTLSKLFNPLNKMPYIQYKQDKLLEAFSVLQILEDEYKKSSSNFYALRSLLESLLHYVVKLKSELPSSTDIDSLRLNSLHYEIEKHFKEERNVEFYARKLNLSAKRLNEIVKSMTGETVTQTLHHRLHLEAKREIVSGIKNIQTISDDLGFENPSYFSRFFKKNEGMTPTEFSTQLFK